MEDFRHDFNMPFVSQARTMAFSRYKMFACEKQSDMRGGSVVWPKEHRLGVRQVWGGCGGLGQVSPPV